MWIKRLRTENWRAFPGENIIEFSTDKNKPISIIHAENEFGKTSLLAAMRWCLHETTPPRVDKNLIDINVSGPAVVELLIESDFEGETYDYLINRKLDENGKKTLTVLVDRKTSIGFDSHTMSDKDVISQLLPPDLGDIFFFSGENLSRAFEEADGETVRRSILKVAGISNANDTRHYLDGYKKKKENEKQTLEDAKIDSKGVKDDINAKEKLIKNLELKKTQAEELYQKCEERISAIDKQLGDNKEDKIKKAADDKVKLIENSKNQIGELSTYKKDRLKLLQKGFHIFTNDVILPTPKRKKEAPLPYSLVFDPATKINVLLDDIKKADECICGRKVNHDESCIKSIERWSVTGKEAGNVLSTFRNVENHLTNYKDEPQNFLTEYDNLEKNIKNKEKSLKDIQDLINEADEILNNPSEKIVAQLNKERDDKEKLRQKTHNDIYGTDNHVGIDEKLKIYKTDLKKLREQKIEDQSPQIKTLEKEINFLSKQIAYLNFLQTNLENKTKNQLSEHINDFCSKYSKVGTRFEFDEYIPQFLTGNQKKAVQASTGKEIQKSIFFGAALVKIAEARKNENHPIISAGCSAAWVCDAPFEGSDEENLKSSAKVIIDHGQGQQLIVFINAKQYKDAFENELKKNKKLGSRCLIQRHITGKAGSNVSTKVKIDGKTYETIKKSDKEYDYSKIIDIR